MSTLFRKAAVDHATSRLAGDVILTAPASLNILCGLLLGVMAIAVTVLSLATFVRYETVSGWIIPNAGLIRVPARDDGVVVAVLVKEDDLVPAGKPIVAIKRSSDLAGGDTGPTLLRAFGDESAAQEAGVDAQRLQLENRRAQLGSKIRDIQREITEARNRVEIGERQSALAEEQVRRADALRAGGFLSAAAVDLRRATALSAADGLSQTRAVVLDYERQLNDARHEVASLPASLASLQAQSGQNRAAAIQRRTTLSTESAVMVTAPIASRVAALPVEVGQAVSGGATLAVLTPRNSAMTAELYIPSRSAGFIAPGQKVRLMYQAFPYQTFGAGRGVVRSVSRTVLPPGDVPLGLKVTEPVFRARVDLESGSVNAYGRSMPLQAGMLLSADVIIERRRLISWVLDPLYAVGRGR
jgi:membrane fusion protein